MSEPHQGNIRLINNFGAVWESLKNKGERSLTTTKKRKRFTAKASVAQRGVHSSEKVILFRQNKKGKWYESARAYECCWGHYTNCYGTGTRIGMYCEALDNYVTSL